MIVLIVDEMDRAAAHRAAPFEHRAVNMVTMKALPTEGREERRMDVDDAAGEVGGDGEEVEKPGHDDEVWRGFPADGKDRLAPSGRCTPLPRQHRDGDPGPAGDVDAANVGPARDNDDHRRSEAPGGNPIEEVFQRSAGARQEHSEAAGRGHARSF